MQVGTAPKQKVTIKAPNFQVAEFLIVGTEPYVSNKFSSESREIMEAKQTAAPGVPKEPRKPKDFDACFNGSMHRSIDGWYGMPAAGFQAGLVRASKYAGFVMKDMKCSILALRDGFDADDRLVGIIRITKGEPEQVRMAARNDDGSCDIRSRGVWFPGWEARVRIRFDADQINLSGVASLLHRMGLSIGIGAGRPDSKESTGQGWGLFDIVGGPDDAPAKAHKAA